MTFDVDKFMGTQFVPRQEEVSIPALKKWFGTKDKTVWTIKGLTGEEIARANEAFDKYNASKALMGVLTQLNRKEIQKQAQKMLGVSDEAPPEIAKRIEHLIFGSVKPVCDLDLAVKLCETFPIEFYDLTNKILKLSGEGMTPGKSMPSGKTQKSKSA